MKKKCSACKEVKFIADFYKNKNSKDGHHLQCAECILLSIDKKARTEEGFLRRRYNNISQSPRHQCYFTFEEFQEAFKKHLKKYGMRSAWGPHHLPITMIHKGIRFGTRGRKKGQSPTHSNLSPDRLNSSKPYTIQNLIFIRFDENSRKKDTTYEDCLAQIKLYEERFGEMKAI